MSSPDHFELFGLPPRFALDTDALDRAYRQVQGQVHPDRFASGTAAERRVAMQWAARANEAYTTLRSAQQRAAYLCERAGVPIEAESNTAMPAAFLMQQMQWREALDEVRTDASALERLHAEMSSTRQGVLDDLAAAIDVDRDFPRAASLVRQLMFIDKFESEIAAAGSSSPRASA